MRVGSRRAPIDAGRAMDAAAAPISIAHASRAPSAAA
jgi:hypothetical protein